MCNVGAESLLFLSHQVPTLDLACLAFSACRTLALGSRREGFSVRELMRVLGGIG
jgi:hypothetical protein